MTAIAVPPTAATPDAKPAPSMKRVAGASLAGTTLEFYDHFIYGAAAALVWSRQPGAGLSGPLLEVAQHRRAQVIADSLGH